RLGEGQWWPGPHLARLDQIADEDLGDGHRQVERGGDLRHRLRTPAQPDDGAVLRLHAPPARVLGEGLADRRHQGDQRQVVPLGCGPPAGDRVGADEGLLGVIVVEALRPVPHPCLSPVPSFWPTCWIRVSMARLISSASTSWDATPASGVPRPPAVMNSHRSAISRSTWCPGPPLKSCPTPRARLCWPVAMAARRSASARSMSRDRLITRPSSDSTMACRVPAT